MSIKIKGFCFLSKLGGVYESSKLFTDLMKSFMILLINLTGNQPSEIYEDHQKLHSVCNILVL